MVINMIVIVIELTVTLVVSITADICIIGYVHQIHLEIVQFKYL